MTKELLTQIKQELEATILTDFEVYLMDVLNRDVNMLMDEDF